MRTIIIGEGHLGTYLSQHVEGAELWRGRMENFDGKDLHAEDVVVCAAGKTDLPWCEANAAEAIRINIAEPVKLFRRVIASDAKYIHLSSGCVWDGPYRADGKAFTPEDPPTPACLYGWTKAACDSMILDSFSGRVVILRPRQVYSPVWSPRNTLTKLLKYERLLDTPNSMTSASTIVRTISLMVSVPDHILWSGVVNVYDRGISSPFKVGMLLAEAGLRKPPERLEKADLDSWHHPRRVDTVLYNEDFERTIQPPEVETELRRVIAAFAREREYA